MGGTGGGDEAGGGSDAEGGGAPAGGGGVAGSGGGSAQGGGMTGIGGGSFAGGGAGGGTMTGRDAGPQGGGFGGGTAGMTGVDASMPGFGGGTGGFGGGPSMCPMFPGTGGGGFIATGGGMGGAGGSACPPPLPAAGALPWGAGFQPQGSQRVQIDGGVCSGRIALGVGDRAVCYTHTDGSLRCAGAVYQTTFGPQFTVVPGQMNVDQILVSLTSNSPTGNAMCIHRADHTAWCMGDFNSHGQFANGDTCPQSTFIKWDNADDVEFLATGSWDQLCAIESTGVRCAGYGFGVTPITVPGQHSTAWFDRIGLLHIDDPSVLRVADYRGDCWVAPDGQFHCVPMDFGTPCTVVQGTVSHLMMPDQVICLLDATGHAQCTDLNNFTHGTVLALGGNFYSTDICAVYADGSLWCRGQNMNGELGTGDMMPVPGERQVQPPGSVRLGCP
jgi:hypothetical protein